MPTLQALKTANKKGFDAGLEGKLLTACPYWKRRSAPYRYAWANGWLSAMMSKRDDIAVECPNCNEVELRTDICIDRDNVTQHLWICENCGFEERNIALDEYFNEGEGRYEEDDI